MQTVPTCSGTAVALPCGGTRISAPSFDAGAWAEAGAGAASVASTAKAARGANARRAERDGRAIDEVMFVMVMAPAGGRWQTRGS
jgi:hypothetical protein